MAESLVLQNGKIAQFEGNKLISQKGKIANVGDIIIDGFGVDDISKEVILEREILVRDGVIIISILIDKKSKQIYDKFGMNINFQKPMANNVICQFPWTNLSVNPYGDISVCCTMSTTALFKPCLLGNLKETELNQALSEAKSAYEGIKDAQSVYDEAKSGLDNVVKGTQDWYEALDEVNQKILEILANYPELWAYVSQGENGLEISKEGWDNLIEQKRKEVKITYDTFLKELSNAITEYKEVYG